jgi:hypothetical protein
MGALGDISFRIDSVDATFDDSSAVRIKSRLQYSNGKPFGYSDCGI